MQKLYAICILLLITSCGGGGGGGGGESAAVPKPSLNLSASDYEISINDSVTITWSSSLATTCAASNSWSGTKATSGSETLTISTAGSNQFTLQCSDSSGASATSSVTVNSGYRISIGELHNSSSVSNIALFIDFNNNLIKDVDEPTFNSASDGSFEYRSTSESEANCQKKFPTVSNDGTLYTPNINQLGDSNISPFSTIFNDLQRNGLKYFTGDDSNLNCNPKNLHFNQRLNSSQANVLKRIETYDFISPSEFNNIGITASERMPDIKKFQQSAKAISDTIEAEFQLAIESSGLTGIASVRSMYELDTSNFRTFLSSSYPNPSTDLMPTASSIDSVAAQAGIIIELSYPKYMGEWNNYTFIVSDDLKITNNAQILSNQAGCFINFSTLCIQNVSLNNIIQYGNFSITDMYQKETARGEEVMQNRQYITDNDTLRCREYDFQLVRNESEDSLTEIGFSEYRGESYFSPDDLDCATYDANGRGFIYTEFFNDGSETYMELWDNQQIFYTHSELYFDDYDSDNLLPSDFPTQTLESMAALESLYTNSVELENLSSSPNPFNILVAILNGDFPAFGISGLSYYVEAFNKDRRRSYFYMDLSSGYYICQSPDKSVSNGVNSSTWSDGLSECFSEIDRNTSFNTERTITNRSPFTGAINE
tara:strand:+ start:154 stop:2118 length:1965 start_codon:yes stop_codon:yes gene_type:complete